MSLISLNFYKQMSLSTYKTKEANFYSQTGLFTIMVNHSPIVSLLQDGVSVKFKDDSGLEVLLDINDGLLYFDGTCAHIFSY